MKKSLIMTLLATMVLPLAACGHNEPQPPNYSDRDYDGLYDSIDPLPERNISGFKHVDDSRGSSNEIIIEVDYRDFLFDNEPVFNNDLAMMAAMISCYSYKIHKHEYSVLTSKYENEESSVNKMLVQFGFSQLENIELDGFEKDEYDTCGLYLGNHVLDYNGKLHQIICVSVDGYALNSAWYSNFDVGADSEIYYEIDGEHPEWTNKKHHKGFDVTANRAYPEILKYAEKVNKKDYDEQIFFVTGHSRGGALSQLFGKKLKDDNYKSVVYGFNGCNVTTEDVSLTNTYSNIFNVMSVHDFVSCFPLEYMGFGKYGKSYYYDLIEENEYYKSLFNHDFAGSSLEELSHISDLFKAVFGSTREDMYKYRDADEDYEEFELASSMSDAEEILDEMNEAIEIGNLKKYVKAEILENKDPETKEENPYLVQYYTRPMTLLRLAGTVITDLLDSPLPIVDIVSTVISCAKFVTRTIGIIIENGIPSLDIDKYALPHTQKTCIAGAHVAKSGE